jgi:hypothetical protein
LLYLLHLNTAHALTWYVHPDSSLNSIQAGLDSCVNNDTVLVGPGTYYENLVWPPTFGIQLVSEYGPDSTVIDGQQLDRVIFIPDIGNDYRGIISGFTITNGSKMDWIGGGIYCCADSFTIANNIISYNEAEAGGGIGVIPTAVTRLIFVYNNTIIDNDSYDGGGIWLSGPGGIITGNIISRNIAHKGGGIHCKSISGNVIIRDNIISRNTANYDGGGIWIDNCTDIIVVNNVIDSNEIILTVTGEGGGIGLWNYSTGTIDSCQITNNINSGVCCNHGSHPTLHYNTITGNTKYGIENKDSNNIIDAEYNWWGDATGPFHPDSNPGGLGDTVSDHVDFIPWLDHPVGFFEESPITHTIQINNITATVFRGPLLIPAVKKYVVFDITGRVVVPDKMRPGIYFIEIDNMIVQKVIKIQ